MSRVHLRALSDATGIDFEIFQENKSYRINEWRGWTGVAPALRILPYGRFGNNLQQIVRATYFAKAIGATTVYIDQVNIGKLGSSRTLSGLDFLPSPPSRRETVLNGNFWDLDAFKRQFSSLDGTQTLAIASQVIRPMLHARWGDRPEKSDDVLHIQIRSGDLFAVAEVHPGYVPPPVAYYRCAVRHFQQIHPKPKIIMVCEDGRNPCIAPLWKALTGEGLTPVMQDGDFEGAVAELLSARTLITSVGTFAPMIALSSPHLRRTYSFREIEEHDSFVAKKTDVVLIGDAEGRYIPLSSWKNSPDQISQIINYPENALRLSGP